MAGVAGFEPAVMESESIALPLGYTPVFIFRALRHDKYFTRTLFDCQEKRGYLYVFPNPPTLYGPYYQRIPKTLLVFSAVISATAAMLIPRILATSWATKRT